MWPGIARKGVCATWGVQWTAEMPVNDDFSLQEFLPPSLVPNWSARALQPEVLLTLSNLTCRQPVDDVCTRDHRSSGPEARQYRVEYHHKPRQRMMAQHVADHNFHSDSYC